MTPSPLISVAELARRYDDPDWLPVDCRFDLMNPAAGEAEYARGHIPGAVYAHLDRDLSSPITPASGRHPLPSPEKFAEAVSSWGIQPGTRVVAHDADNSAYASRLWWLLRWAGHPNVFVLDGGFKAWRAAGLPISTSRPERQPSNFVARPDNARWVDVETVTDKVARPDWAVLDARAPERFAGEVEPIDKVAGHVPGARNYPLGTSLTGDATFLPAAELRTRLEKSLAGVSPSHTIAMCGSGVTACHVLLAMEQAGLTGAKLYAGSWSEWIRDPHRPTAKGKN
jgi:thiosulfate/3-mercaptopyruvate sulfurtransferase